MGFDGQELMKGLRRERLPAANDELPISKSIEVSIERLVRSFVRLYPGFFRLKSLIRTSLRFLLRLGDVRQIPFRAFRARSRSL